MNNEEATFLLHGYRPDGSDAQDPQFAGSVAVSTHASLQSSCPDGQVPPSFIAPPPLVLLELVLPVVVLLLSDEQLAAMTAVKRA